LEIGICNKDFPLHVLPESQQKKFKGNIIMFYKDYALNLLVYLTMRKPSTAVSVIREEKKEEVGGS